MTTAERIQTLLHRHSKEEVAAILGITTAEVASYDFDHSDVPENPVLADFEARLAALEAE